MESGGEKVMASLPSVGRVTKASRMPKRAKGLFIPLADSTTPRRSPRLLAWHTVLFMSFAHLASKRGDLLGVVEHTFSPLKVCSFHRLTQQRPEDRLACSLPTRSLFTSFARLAIFWALLNTPLALFGMREAFVTLRTEGRLAITFSPSDSIVALSQYQSFDNSCCMGEVTYVHTYTCVIIIPKFSNTTSVGKNWKFNQVHGRFTLPPSSFFLNYALLAAAR